jgi:hypothetical protein
MAGYSTGKDCLDTSDRPPDPIGIRYHVFLLIVIVKRPITLHNADVMDATHYPTAMSAIRGASTGA